MSAGEGASEGGQVQVVLVIRSDPIRGGKCSSIYGLCSFNQGRPRIIEKDGEGLR